MYSLNLHDFPLANPGNMVIEWCEWLQTRKAKAVKRKRREKSMQKRANQRAKDLRGRLQDAKSEVSKMKFAKDLDIQSGKLLIETS